MGKNFTAVFAVCLAISALPLACGDDEDDDGGDGNKGGNGGSSGSTNGGTAGTGKGGTSGTGGSTGGTAGTAGKGGTGGTTGGSAGTGTGGTMGGEGGMGGAEGGMGGEGGGGTEPTLCERYCDAGDVANCVNTTEACITTCENNIAYGISVNPDCEDLLNTLYECSIDGAPADWACNQNQPSYGGDDCLEESMAANDGFCFG